MAYLLAGAAGLFYLLYKGKREASDRSLQRSILKEVRHNPIILREAQSFALSLSHCGLRLRASPPRFVFQSPLISKLPAQYQDLFDIPTQRLRDVQRDLILQVEAGLRGDKAGLLMLPTFVDILPTG